MFLKTKKGNKLNVLSCIGSLPPVDVSSVVNSTHTAAVYWPHETGSSCQQVLTQLRTKTESRRKSSHKDNVKNEGTS